jgi:hypothetical protein
VGVVASSNGNPSGGGGGIPEVSSSIGGASGTPVGLIVVLSKSNSMAGAAGIQLEVAGSYGGAAGILSFDNDASIGDGRMVVSDDDDALTDGTTSIMGKGGGRVEGNGGKDGIDGIDGGVESDTMGGVSHIVAGVSNIVGVRVHDNGKMLTNSPLSSCELMLVDALDASVDVATVDDVDDRGDG